MFVVAKIPDVRIIKIETLDSESPLTSPRPVLSRRSVWTRQVVL